MYIVFDIGGSSIKYARMSKNGEIIYSNKFVTPKTYDEFFLKICEKIEEKEIEGICFSSPGSVDKLTGEIGGISAVEYIHNNNFSKQLKEKYNLNVSIENDANCAALGEIYFSENKYDLTLFLVIGSGIGGAVLKNGKLINGKVNEAGEFGYMMFNYNSKENLSSLSTLPNVVLKLKKEKNINTTTFLALDEYFNKKEPYYTYVRNSFEYLAIAIYNLKYIYDPDILLIGGAISSEKRYVDEIKKYVNKLGINIEIRTCKNFNDNNLLGALANHLQKNYIN